MHINASAPTTSKRKYVEYLKTVYASGAQEKKFEQCTDGVKAGVAELVQQVTVAHFVDSHKQQLASEFDSYRVHVEPGAQSRGIGDDDGKRRSTRRGLVVGINPYRSKSISDLAGAENDADGYFEVLVTHGEIPAPDVRTLKGEDATLENVQAELNDMLGDAPTSDPVDPTRADAAAGAPAAAAGADVLVFTFCGHGTSQRDTTKPSGESQRLVMHDSEWDTPSESLKDGLPDLWIKAWIQRAKALGKTVFIILDCSHSSNMSRGVGGEEEKKEDMVASRCAVPPWLEHEDVGRASRGGLGDGAGVEAVDCGWDLHDLANRFGRITSENLARTGSY